MSMIDNLVELLGQFDVVDLSQPIENYMPRNSLLPPLTVTKTQLIERDGFYQQVSNEEVLPENF